MEMEHPGLDVNPLHLNSSPQQLLFLLGTLPQSWWMAESGSHCAVSSKAETVGSLGACGSCSATRLTARPVLTKLWDLEPSLAACAVDPGPRWQMGES